MNTSCLAYAATAMELRGAIYSGALLPIGYESHPKKQYTHAIHSIPKCEISIVVCLLRGVRSVGLGGENTSYRISHLQISSTNRHHR